MPKFKERNMQDWMKGAIFGSALTLVITIVLFVFRKVILLLALKKVLEDTNKAKSNSFLR